MQSLCTVEFFEKQPPETYGIKLDTIENDKSNEADDTEKSSEKAEAEQDIHFHIDLGKEDNNILPLKSSLRAYSC